MSENNGKFRVSIGMITVVFLLICQLVGFSFGYGMLNQQVKFNRELIAMTKANQDLILLKLEEVTTKLITLSVIVDGKFVK